MRVYEYEDVTIRHTNRLPHWYTPRGIYSVTFRLADALPLREVTRLRADYDRGVEEILALPRELQDNALEQVVRTYRRRVERLLDSGSGRCDLLRAEAADVVAGTIAHFDGDRYRTVTSTVMPNHVHTTFVSQPEWPLQKILHSWKSYSAKEANRLLGRTGEFWHSDYYDTLIRDSEHLRRVVEYTMNNPAKAGLSEWKWVQVNHEVYGSLI